MLGLIGLIIATYLQNNEKSPCKIDIYVAPLLFSLAPQCPPTFFFLESPLGLGNLQTVGTYFSTLGTFAPEPGPNVLFTLLPGAICEMRCGVY